MALWVTYIILLYLTIEVTWNYRVVLEGDDLVLRNIFMIDLSGVIKHLSVNNKLVGHSLEEILHLEKQWRSQPTQKDFGVPYNKAKSSDFRISVSRSSHV